MQIARYTVIGVERASGNDVEWVVEAASEENARAKAELRGAVVTSIRRPKDTLTPAAPGGGDATHAPMAADEAARRWAWKRIAKWAYNWYLLLGVWIVMGLLLNLSGWSEFQQRTQGHWVSPGMMSLAVAELVVTSVLITLLFLAQRLMRQRIDAAANFIQWLLIARCALNVLDFLMVILILPGPNTPAAVMPPLIGSTFWCAVCLPFIRPLRKPRFAAFSRMVNHLLRHGVPMRFITDAAVRDDAAGQTSGFDPTRPNVVQLAEPTTKYGWSRLVRSILVGVVVIPEEVRFELALPPASPGPCTGAHTADPLPIGRQPGAAAVTPVVAKRGTAWRCLTCTFGVSALVGGCVLLNAIAKQPTPTVAATNQVSDTAPAVDNGKEHWPTVFSLSNNDVPPASEDDLASGGKALEQMEGAYGFYIYQTWSIDVLESKFPAYRRQLESARDNFDIRFKNAIDNIDRILGAKAPDWAQARWQLRQSAEQQIRPDGLTESATIGYLTELRQRSNGKMPILETLLTFDPTYMAQPDREFADGYIQVYRTGANEASHGLRLTIEYPRSWRAQSSERQNVVQLLTSEDGRGTTLLSLAAMPLPDAHARVSDADIDELSREGIGELVWKQLSRNIKTLDSGVVSIGGRRAAWAENTCAATMVGIEMQFHGLTFIFADDNRIICLMFMSGAVPGVSKSTADDEFKRHTRLFQLMLTTLVVQRRTNVN